MAEQQEQQQQEQEEKMPPINEGEAKETNDTNSNSNDVKETENGAVESVKEENNNNNNNVGGGDFDPLKNLTEEQLEALKKMREKTSKYFTTDEERAWANDMCLLRYLRARDYSVQKAKKVCSYVIYSYH